MQHPSKDIYADLKCGMPSLDSLDFSDELNSPLGFDSNENTDTVVRKPQNKLKRKQEGKKGDNKDFCPLDAESNGINYVKWGRIDGNFIVNAELGTTDSKQSKHSNQKKSRIRHKRNGRKMV